MKKRSYDNSTRAARAAATRERIRACATELYDAGSIDDFTLAAVAERAETTVQTVLRLFESREKLLYAVLEGLTSREVPLRQTTPGDTAAAVSAIFDVYETSGDLILDMLAQERRSGERAASLQAGRDNQRAWAARIFAPILERCNASTRITLFHLIAAATDVYVWQVLRRDSGLSRRAAETVVRSMIDGAMRAGESDGAISVAELVRRR